MSLDAIKARLGSIHPRKMATYSGAARTLLQDDLPDLIELASAVELWIESDGQPKEHNAVLKAFGELGKK